MPELRAFKLGFGSERYVAWAPDANKATRFTILHRLHVKAGTHCDSVVKISETEADKLGAKRPMKLGAKGKVYKLLFSNRIEQVWPF